MSSNILILSAGRRVELVQAFRHAAIRVGTQSTIVAADQSPLAPALYFSDIAIRLPPIGADDYIPALLRVADRHNIALIVPTIDTELTTLAQHAPYIEQKTGAKVLVSNETVIRTCRDKMLTAEFIQACGLLVPTIRDADAISPHHFPLFIKPRGGSSSVDAYKVETQAELEAYLQIVDNPMLQDFAKGDEYTVDCFMDFGSKIISIVPRLRIATRSGEISKGRIVMDPGVIEPTRHLLRELQAIGHITVQGIMTDRGFQFIEVNARFGGGAPMSITAGADSCEYLYKLLQGKRPERPSNIADGMTFLRYDASVMVDGSSPFDTDDATTGGDDRDR